MDRLENAIELTENDVEYEAKALAEEAEYLSRKLAEVAKRAREVAAELPIDDRGKAYSGINSLGECQGAAHDVDRRCATLASKIEKLNTLKYVAKV